MRITDTNYPVSATFEFEGVSASDLAAQTILHWRVTVISLEQLAATGGILPASCLDEAGKKLPVPDPGQQFIYIDALQADRPVLVVTGLKTTAVDESVLEKTRIMLQQYKRLQPGLHQFG